MSEETESRHTGQAGLAEIHDQSIVEERSQAAVLVDLLLGRWLTILAILSLAATSYLLVYFDQTVSIDAIVFGLLTVALALYFLATLASDLRFE